MLRFASRLSPFRSAAVSVARPVSRTSAATATARWSSSSSAQGGSDDPSNPKTPFLDPFPLPLSNGPITSATVDFDPEGNPVPLRLPRGKESDETMRARLVYQTRKRGTLETDLLLSTFAREFLPQMSREEMEEFDKLLDENDWSIYYWAIEKKQPPERWVAFFETPGRLGHKLRKHARNEGKVVRRMPDLVKGGLGEGRPGAQE